MRNLKLLRHKKKITQIRLSVAVEVSQETISAYESGKTMPSADTLIKLADFLDTSVDYLLERADNLVPIYYQKGKNDELSYYFRKLNEKDRERSNMVL